MTAFWVSAALLAGVALAFLLVPISRMRRRTGKWSRLPIAVAAAAVPAALALYLGVTSYDPNVSVLSAAERDAVARLAARMAENPDDVEGWLFLGRSYMALGEYELGRGAYTEAWSRTSAPDNELKLAYAEALILTDGAAVSGEGGQLVEEVLASEPSNPRALWYGGLVAAERGRTDLARTRWTRFLALVPPEEEVAQTIRRVLAELPPEGGSLGPAIATGEGAASGAGAVSGADGASGEGFTLALDISVAPSLPFDALPPQAMLFIFARAPGERAPVAVIREPVASLPGDFTLSDRNVMIQGRSLAAFPELELVARISLSGQPGEQTGDLFAATTYRQGEAPAVALVIDQVVP